MPDLVRIEKVSKRFGSKLVLDGISLVMPENAIVGLLGPNGTGKSTLMQILNQTLPPDSGSVSFLGGIKSSNEIKRMVALVPQEYAFFSDFTVEQNLRFFASQIRSNASQNWNQRIESILSNLGLVSFRNTSAQFLSGGYKRLLNIGISLLEEPKLLLLDEPTVGLDPVVRSRLWSVIRKLNRQQTTICISTHYMEEAQALCDVVCLMNAGKIVAVGSPSELISKFAPPFVIQVALENPLDASQLPALEGILSSEVKSPSGQLSLAQKVNLRVEQENVMFEVNQNPEVLSALVREFFETRGIPILRMITRTGDLELVFSKLTGEELKGKK